MITMTYETPYELAKDKIIMIMAGLMVVKVK